VKTWIDEKTGLEWLVDANYFGRLPWINALSACKYLIGGGFRLPTVAELFSLLDYSKCMPAVRDDVGIDNILSTSYWSSVPYSNHDSYAWRVFLYYGQVNYELKKTQLGVLPVRVAEVTEDEQSEANPLRGVMPCSFVRSVDSQKHTFLDDVGTWHHKPYYGPQRKVVDYDVLIEAPEQLCMEIRKRLKDGWELLGGVSVYYSTTGALQRSTLQLVQAVVKYE